MAMAALGSGLVHVGGEDDPIALLAAGAERRTTRCGAGWLTWRLWGTGRPLVLLHGDAGSWQHWLRNIPVLAKNFRVLVPDLPGYGDSDLPPEPWSPLTLAQLLAAGLHELLPPRRRYVAAGFSFGGIIAAQLAAVDAPRVDRLAVLSPGGVGLPVHHRALPLRRMQPEMDAAARAEVHRHNLAALMFADAGNVDAVALRMQLHNVACWRLRIGDMPESDWLLRGLAQVAAPLLAIWGEHDAFAGGELAARETALRRLCPDVDFRVLPGVGHFVQYEAADRINAMLTEWL